MMDMRRAPEEGLGRREIFGGCEMMERDLEKGDEKMNEMRAFILSFCSFLKL